MSTVHRQIHPVEFKKRKERTAAAVTSQSPASSSSQQLLAGYMAYEFLTRGTMLGQELDPGQPESVATKIPNSEEVDGDHQLQKKNKKSYAEVASLLKTDGAHLPWVVNPTQLAHWVQMR